MSERFGPYNDDPFNKVIFHEAIVVKDKRLESLIWREPLCYKNRLLEGMHTC